MVTDLRPLRVQSADMVDLMRGFAERFRNESGLALDLLIDSANCTLRTGSAGSFSRFTEKHSTT